MFFEHHDEVFIVLEADRPRHLINPHIAAGQQQHRAKDAVAVDKIVDGVAGGIFELPVQVGAGNRKLPETLCSAGAEDSAAGAAEDGAGAAEEAGVPDPPHPASRVIESAKANASFLYFIIILLLLSCFVFRMVFTWPFCEHFLTSIINFEEEAGQCDFSPTSGSNHLKSENLFFFNKA